MSPATYNSVRLLLMQSTDSRYGLLETFKLVRGPKMPDSTPMQYTLVRKLPERSTLWSAGKFVPKDMLVIP